VNIRRRDIRGPEYDRRGARTLGAEAGNWRIRDTVTAENQKEDADT
jgi:hypothetical protein